MRGKDDSLEFYFKILEKINTGSMDIGVEVLDEIHMGLAHSAMWDKSRYNYLLGRYYILKVDFLKAIEILSTIKEMPSTEEFYTESQHYLGKAYFNSHSAHLALAYLHNVYRTERGKEGTYWYYVTRFIEGQCYADMNLFHEANLIFDKIIHGSSEVPKSAIFGSCIMSANLYKYLEKFDDGLALIDKAEATYFEFKDELPPNSWGNLLKHKADLLRNYGRYNQAFELYQQALSEGVLHIQEMISLRNAMAICYTSLKQYGLAASIWQELLSMSQVTQNPYLVITMHIGLSDIYAEQNDFKQAFKTVLAVEDKLENIDSERLILAYYEKCYQFTKKSQYGGKALFYLEKIHDLQKTIASQEQKRKIEAVKAINRLEVEKKENEIMRKEVEINKQKLDMTLLLLQQKNTLLDELDDFVSELRRDNLQKKTLFAEIHGKIKSSKKMNIHEAEVALKLSEPQNEFIKRLRNKFDRITPTEAKVAFLLSKNMNSKEISELLIMEVKTIEQYRYRLRQKMQLKKADKLELILGLI